MKHVATGPVPEGAPVLLLIGGGHAHVQVLESLARRDWPPVRTILLSPQPRQVYSGMVPGYLQGRYTADDITIDLAGLCRLARVEFVKGRAEAIDLEDRAIATADRTLPFDLLSLDVGSVPQGHRLPGVREHAIWLKSLDRLRALCERLDRLAALSGGRRAVRVGVIGGGAGGIEVALAAGARIRSRGGSAEVVVIERGDRILPSYPRRARRHAQRALASSGGKVLLNREVAEVEEGGLVFADDERITVDLTIWVGGAAPPPLLDASDLPHSQAGYFAVDETLRASDGAPVWGAGDCVDIVEQPLPKAGVYAVRQGPVLSHNLRASLLGESARRYRPQKSFLSLLDTADGRAILRRGPLALHNSASLWLKERIDRNFVRRFRMPADA
ncbi:MAG: FAD-dependent oxidoreductase [Gemmatimonadota bacterium]